MSRKLDASIAEALGYQIHPHIGLCKFEKDVEDYRGLVTDRWMPYKDGSIPYYSTDGNAMLELDKEMRERGWQLFYFRSDVKFDEIPFAALYITGDSYLSYPGEIEDCGQKASTEPLSRALAAYKALTGEDWREEK